MLTWTAACGMLITLSSAALAVPPDDPVVHALSADLPREGLVQCVLERASDGEFAALGFDLGTGDWYEVRLATARARWGGGSLYFLGGNQQTRGLLGTADRNLFIEQWTMPFIWLRHVIEHPDRVTKAERLADGGLAIEVEAPLGDPTLSPTEPIFAYRLVIGPDGRLTRAKRLDINDEDVIRYLGEAAPGYPIASIAPGDWTLLEAGVTRGRIDRTLVDSVASRIFAWQAEAKQAIARSKAPSTIDPGEAPAGGAIALDRFYGLGRPLMLTGVLAALLGLYFWWRARRT